MVVKYKNLVTDFENITGTIFKYHGINWHDSINRFDEHALTRGKIKTPSYNQVTKPIYKNAISRWHNYKRQLEPFLNKLKLFIE